MNLRRTCSGCGGTRRKAFWTDEQRTAVIARCRDCGCNFYGADVTLPLEWAPPTALMMAVDPGPEGARAT